MKYLVKIWWGDEKRADIKIMSEQELIEWFDMSDCYVPFDYEVYIIDPRFKEASSKITFADRQPEGLIEFISEEGDIVASGHSTDHQWKNDIAHLICKKD